MNPLRRGGALAALMMVVARGAAAQTSPPAPAQDRPSSFFADYFAMVKEAAAEQPRWSSPLVTTTALLEERFRADMSFQHAGNGADSAELNGGRGLDLIVSGMQEIQLGAPPYVVRNAPARSASLGGFNDWPFLRFKQRLASHPRGEGNDVLSAWLQLQAPSGIGRLSNRSWTLLPTLGFGKGWGDFDVQGTFGAVIPVAHEAQTGSQIASNIALQYHVGKLLWPQIEVNWTYFPDGQRGGKSQIYLTPGLVVGRIRLAEHLAYTIGLGYQVAVTPNYRPSPLLPAYNHALVVTTRVSF